MKKLSRFPKLKKLVYFFIPRFTRMRLLWTLETFKFLFKNKLLVPRTKSDYMFAEDFSCYWENLSVSAQNSVRQKLLRNLDSLSIETVNNFIKRQSYIASHNILEQSNIFTKEEIEQQRECSRTIQKITRKMSHYNFSLLSSECFYGLSGLRWLPSKVKKEKLENGIFIDVGAFEGDTSIFLSMNFNPKHIYAFEPENKNFEILKNNCKLKYSNTIIPIKAGLSNQAGKAHITSNGGESHLSQNGLDQELELLIFDDFWREFHPKEKIALIKMDVEGAEIQALKGMEQAINAYRPVLAISIYHKAEDFFTIKPWLENICPEYKFMIRKASPFSLTGETMLLAYID